MQKFWFLFFFCHESFGQPEIVKENNGYIDNKIFNFGFTQTWGDDFEYSFIKCENGVRYVYGFQKSSL
jgi:hypothetical protein